MEALNLEDLPIEQFQLELPSLNELTLILSRELPSSYENVQVDVVDCPDLTQPPFNLAAKGCGGKPTVFQIGDPSYVIPKTLKNKIYDFKYITEVLQERKTFIIGAGGGCWPAIGKFCEMWANVLIEDDKICNLTKEIYCADQTIDEIAMQNANVNETRFSVLGNLFSCQGESCKVIQIQCKKRRSGDGDLPKTVNLILGKELKHASAFGAIMLMTAGKAKHHTARNFSNALEISAKSINDFLIISSLPAPFVSLGTLVPSASTGCSIQDRHFHSITEVNTGGHFHCDVTPDEAEFKMFLIPAEMIYCIDAPSKSLNIFDHVH